MDQILGYLSIRSELVSLNDEQLEEIYGSFEGYKYFVEAIDYISGAEDLLFIDDKMNEKIKNLISKYRFEYKVPKETCEQVNNIIGRLNEIDRMDVKERVKRTRDYYAREIKDRKLPFSVDKYTKNDILNYIMLDSYYAKSLLSGDIKDVYEIGSINPITTINLILSAFRADIVEEPEILDRMYDFIQINELVSKEILADNKNPILNVMGNIVYKNFINRTYKNLATVEYIVDESKKLQKK